MGVYEKAYTTIRREQMLSPDCAVVVGVSGGADSVTLLHLLHTLRQEGMLATLQAVHMNHGLRGAESDRDEQFVRDLCDRLQIPLHVCRCDIGALAAQTGKGIEETGREQRYFVFEQAANRFKNSRIATAHTADDNAETLLLHLCRGSGLHGAGGIPPVRGNVIRPLISCTRAEIEAYCAEHGLCYVTDSSNADTAYARNRIRLEVMPALRAVNPQVSAAMERFMEQARQTDRFLDRLTEQALLSVQGEAPHTYDRDALLALEEPIRSRVLCRIAATAEACHIHLLTQALEQGSGSITLPTGRRFTVTDTTLKPDPLGTQPVHFCHAVTVGNRYTVGEHTYTVKTLPMTEYEQKLNILPKLFQNALDCDKIKGDLILRGRLDGDSYHPAGRNCGKSLKKLFNETKTEQRDTVPLLCDADGIVLVCGFGCDERVRLTAQTTKVLVVEKEENG